MTFLGNNFCSMISCVYKRIRNSTASRLVVSNTDYVWPRRIVEIADLCLQHGIRKPLIVTDKGSEKLPFSIKLQELLNNGKITFDVFADISPNL